MGLIKMLGKGLPYPRLQAGLVCVFFTLGLVGCSGSKQKTVYPVKGKVTIGGKQVAGVMVLFHLQDNKDPEFHNPFGITAEDGTFVVTTYSQGDGAPEGNYIVTLLYEPMEPPMLRKNKETPKINRKYLDAKSSPLTATVEKKSANDLPTFEVP